MPADAKVIETLEALNRGYLLAAEKRDVGWYAEHLAEDYMATNPDGSLVDKAGFLGPVREAPFHDEPSRAGRADPARGRRGPDPRELRGHEG
jgi:hypothetical protein